MANQLYVRFVVVSLSGSLSFATLSAADETRWVPYSAHYTETVSSSGPSGNTSKHSVLDESRSEDGSMLSVSKVHGREVKGKLWLANGEVDDLDYTRQQAIVSAHAPRVHAPLPKVPPTGSEVIAGLPCSVYPIQMISGSGQLCLDVGDDILLKEEIHMDTGKGMHTDYVKQMSSIDVGAPVNNSAMKIPNGFKKPVKQ